VRTSGVEDVKAALRRNAWAILALVLLGAAAMTIIKRSAGAEYRGAATVVLAPTDLSANLTGIQPVYVDPSRQDTAERNMATAPQLFDLAARRTGFKYGNGRDMQGATGVSVDNNLVSFSSTAESAAAAAAIANASANAYPAWRAQVFGGSIQNAIDQLRTRLKSGGNATISDQLQKLELLKSVGSKGGVLFVEPARNAVQIAPRPKRDIVLGAVIGLIIGLVLAGVREVLDTRVRSDSDVEEALGVPVLASVQSLPRRARSQVYSLGQSKYADTYELLAANLVQLLGDSEETQSLAVTSAVAGEGKTTTAVHLGAALARRGMRVVVADFDLRRPTLARLFAIPDGAPGVTEILQGTARLSAALWSAPVSPDGARAPEPSAAGRARSGGRQAVDVKTEGGSLVVLPAGKPTSTGGSGSLFSRLPELLRELSPQADIVLLDTPPALLAAGVAELSRSVDGLLVVVRQGVAPKRKLRTLARQAHAWRANLIGAVLNDTPREVGYGYYYSPRST